MSHHIAACNEALCRLPVRLISFALAVMLSALLLVDPRAIPTDDAGHVPYLALMALLWGVAFGYVHGSGYIPRNKWWRYAMGPLLGLPLMAIGSACLWLW